MFQNVVHHLFDTLRREQDGFTVDGLNFFVLNIVAAFDGFNVVNTEGEYVAVINRINDRIGVQLAPKGLLRRAQEGIPIHLRVRCKTILD